MIKVLDKSFGILEAVVNASPRPMRISVLAEKIGINVATCARIVRDLVDADYLDQVSRQEGYTVGPRMLTLGNNVAYKPWLVKCAARILSRTAETVSASVMLAERRGDLRYILYHRNCCTKLPIEMTEIAYRDLLSTATGLMLASYMPVEERAEMIAGYEDDGLVLYDENTDFDLIRAEQQIEFRDSRRAQGIAAFPVLRGDELIGVVGGSIYIEDYAGTRKEEFLRALKDAALNISREITTINTIG